MQERSFSFTFLDRTTVNMTSSFEVEEEMDEDGASKENYSGDMDKIVAALEAMLIRLNWGTFSVWLMRHTSIWSPFCNT